MPAPPPPPPPGFSLSNSISGDQGRGALLQSIRAGKTLKKTVTVDKSAPVISGKVKSTGNHNSSNNGGSNNIINSNSSNNVSNSSINNGTPAGLGGLFAGGIPKLKPTGLRGNLEERNNGNSVNNSSINYASNTHTMPNVKRGPPPVPPPLIKQQVMNPESFLHSEFQRGFGKSTHAPKPPTSAAPKKPSPPPKKLNLTAATVSRAQSMRLPRSPPVLAPAPPSLHQSQDCLNATTSEIQQKRILRPPIARPPSPPISRANSTATITRAAPPPPSRVTVVAPNIPPPPPPLPHRSAPTHQRTAPPPPPPTPPMRGTSMKNGQAINLDLEARFTHCFHSIAEFPPPDRFTGCPKVYNSKLVAAKQQAPQPPQRLLPAPNSMVQLNTSSGNKQWHQSVASSAC